MKIKIMNSDGKGHNTKITNAETGEKLGPIRKATILCTNENMVTAELTFNIPSVHVLATAKLSEKTKNELKDLQKLLELIEKEETIP